MMSVKIGAMTFEVETGGAGRTSGLRVTQFLHGPGGHVTVLGGSVVTTEAKAALKAILAYIS